jgi:hypothetical protein
MGRMLAIAAMISLFAAWPSAAQTGGPGAAPMGMPGASPAPYAAPMGMPGATAAPGTTPALGTLDPMSPVGGSGIPLAASELFTGGLSPAPLVGSFDDTVCQNAAAAGIVPTAPSPASPSNVFDNGGTTPPDVNPAFSTRCSTAPAVGFPVSSGLSSVPGSAAVTPSSGSSFASIPLAATQQSDAGLSGPIGVPVPSPALTACPGMSGIFTGIAPALGSGSPYVGATATLSLPLGC